MRLHGKDLVILADGVAVAAAKTCSLDVDADTIGVASATDSEWNHSVAGRKSWKISTNHLIECLEAYGGKIALRAYAADIYSENGNNAFVSSGISTFTMNNSGMMVVTLDAAGEWAGTSRSFSLDSSESVSEAIAFLDTLSINNMTCVVINGGDIFVTSALLDSIAALTRTDLNAVPTSSVDAFDGALCAAGGGDNDNGLYSYVASGGYAAVSSYLHNGTWAESTPLKDAVGRVGRTFDIRVCVEGFPNDVLTGQAICKTWNSQATKGNLMTGAYKWEGTGPLE